MRDLFVKSGGLRSIISFQRSTNAQNEPTFSTHWDSTIYVTYCDESQNGHVITIDFYSDRETIEKYGTQSATLLCVRFSNIDMYSEY